MASQSVGLKNIQSACKVNELEEHLISAESSGNSNEVNKLTERINPPHTKPSKLCCSRITPYLSVAISGIVYTSVVSGLYSWMTNVDEVELMPSSAIEHSNADVDKSIFYAYKDGIFCGVDEGYNVFNASYCLSMNEYDCGLRTDLSHKILYDEIPSFRTALILFFILTGLYAMFSIIHDWTLIYHRNHLDKLISYPQDLFYWAQKISHFHDTIERKCHNVFCRALAISLLCVPILIGLCLDVLAIIYMFTLYPFYILVTGCNFGGFSYVSSAWVGISSGLMIFVATYIIMVTQNNPLEYHIPLTDVPLHCWCTCSYRLKSKDFWSFIVVASGIGIKHVMFLWAWYQESVHGEQFLYLVDYKYSLPLFKAVHMNQDDNPTGNMFGSRHASSVQSDIVSNPNINTMTPTTRKFRLFCGLIVGWGSYFWLMITIMVFGVNNQYEYPQWIAQSIIIIFFILCIVSAFFLSCIDVLSKSARNCVWKK
eukprot:899760_1